MRRAEEIREAGGRIEILSELRFLERAGRTAPVPMAPKTYPADEVCRLLAIDRATLERWELFELVRDVEGRYDFQDLVSLRAIAALVDQGVRIETLARSLRQIGSAFPRIERPLAQLRVVAERPELLTVTDGRMASTPAGQGLLDLGPAPAPEPSSVVALDAATSAEWFEQGQGLEDASELRGAAEAYRRALSLDPGFGDARFNLGNVLRELGDVEDAMIVYRELVEQDGHFAAGWYNLADLHEEQGAVDEAARCLERAVGADPTFSDAHYNLALCYEQLDRADEAREHWRRYLALDPNSEWARLAEQHLKLL